MSPFKSTTAMLTCADEPSGRRICARARWATAIAFASSDWTSAALREPSDEARGA